MYFTKKTLAIFLSKLKSFEHPKIEYEQYMTPSELAADILWFAKISGDLVGKVIADLGAGTGIFGIGSLLLGAGFVYFVEIDPDAVEILKENIKTAKISSVNYLIFNKDVSEFNEKVDTVFMNPPFGLRGKYGDTYFIDHAVKISDTIYSIHKAETVDFVRRYYRSKGFKTVWESFEKFQIPLMYEFHEKKKEIINVVWIKAIRDLPQTQQ